MNYLSIRTKQPQADISKDGVLRSLIEIESALCTVETFQQWKKMAFNTGDERSCVSGLRLRELVSAITKTAALANGAHDKRIDTHSLRAGGAEALYTQGVLLDIIQRWGRWESLTFHQFLRRGATSPNKLSEVPAKPDGMLKCLRLMNNQPKSAPFQLGNKTMADQDVQKTDMARSDLAALFSPNENSKAGSSTSETGREVGASVYSATDHPPYAATPSDHQSVFWGTRALTKQGKREKQGESSEDGDVTKAELFPVKKKLRHGPLKCREANGAMTTAQTKTTKLRKRYPVVFHPGYVRALI